MVGTLYEHSYTILLSALVQNKNIIFINSTDSSYIRQNAEIILFDPTDPNEAIKGENKLTAHHLNT